MKVQRILKWSCAMAVAVCGLTFTSCCGNGELTESDVKKEVKKELFSVMDYFTTASIEVGYYEENDADDRMRLRKLAAAGMITYKAERIVEYKKNYWGSRKVNHVFVDVALTEKGQKYVISHEELTKMREEIEEKALDKDLVCPNKDEEYPEDAVPVEEDMPTIDDQAKPEAAASEAKSQATELEADYGMEEDHVSTPATAEKSSYEKALAKAGFSTVIVKLYKMELSKVRRIRCTAEMLEQGKAKAQIILAYVDVTPFGRVLRNVRDGQKVTESVSFVKYTDGWVADKD